MSSLPNPSVSMTTEGASMSPEHKNQGDELKQIESRESDIDAQREVDEEVEDLEEDSEEEEEEQHEHVRFGSVRVHRHKLTLGDNPGVSTVGPPLTLEWDPSSSERYENVDDFTLKNYGRRDSQSDHKAHVLKAGVRQQIAAQGHSAGSIRRIQAQVYETQEGRKKSALEDPTKFVGDDKAQKGKTGFFHGLFHKSH